MNWADKIKNNFVYQGKSGLTDECNINLDQIAEQLEIKEKAQTDAGFGLPASDSSKANSAEREVQGYFENRMAAINRIVNDELSLRNTSITDTNLEDERALINNHTEHSKLSLKSLVAREFRALKQTKQELDNLQKEFSTFQQQNTLSRTPHYPDSQILYFSIVLIFWLLESAGNGYFFAEGSALGLLGGIGQAIIIAAINISVAFFFMGWLFRYKNHCSVWKQLIAFLSFLVYIASAFGFNLLVAHYRDFFAVNPEQAGVLAVQRFMEIPWGLSEFNSWMLFFMGLLFAVFAFIDGYKRDDVYPGYGKLHRRLQSLNEEYEEHRDYVVTGIGEVRQAFLDNLDDMKQAVLLKHTRLVHLVEDKQAFVAEYEQGMANFVAAANTLIYRYRDFNMSYRKDSAPAYFSQDWHSNNHYKVRGAHDDIERVEQQKQLFNDFPGYCQQRTNEIEKLYVLFLQQLQEIDPDYKSDSHNMMSA
mgnify:FL=1